MKLLIAFMGMALANPPTPESSYRKSVEDWRLNRENRLKAEDGWLSLAGLFWLKEGSNSVGSDPSALVLLPKGAAPLHVGELILSGKTLRFKPAVGSEVRVNGKRISEELEVKSDETEKPDLLEVGRLKILLIKRSKGYGVRVKDPESATRKSFHGLSWFPVQESYRVRAKFERFETHKKIHVPNILGDTDESESPGQVVFTLNGKEHRLTAILEDGEYFFIFKDDTNGKGTYPSGRFLYTPVAKEGLVDLDFNKAFTPPCGFTKFATCPLPPRENFLKAKILAGEKFSGHHAGNK